MFLEGRFNADIFLEGIFDANIFRHVEEKGQHVDGYFRRLRP
jgi:hypothetical protein